MWFGKVSSDSSGKLPSAIPLLAYWLMKRGALHMRFAIVFLAAAALAPVWPQAIKLPPNLEKLGAKAETSVDITLDGSMLQLAAKFLSDKDSEEVKAKKLITGLESITVHSFEFAREGE